MPVSPETSACEHNQQHSRVPSNYLHTWLHGWTVHWWWSPHSLPFHKIWAGTDFFFLMEKMLLNSFSLTSPVPQLLSITAHSVSGPNPIKSRAAKLRETLLINFYKWCNASFSFSNSQCGCYFLWKKGKKHEEQICNSTEQFLVLKTLTAITCSRVLHRSRDFSEKKKPTSFLPCLWTNELQPPRVQLMFWKHWQPRLPLEVKFKQERSTASLLDQADTSIYFQYSRMKKSAITSLMLQNHRPS